MQDAQVSLQTTKNSTMVKKVAAYDIFGTCFGESGFVIFVHTGSMVQGLMVRQALGMSSMRWTGSLATRSRQQGRLHRML